MIQPIYRTFFSILLFSCTLAQSNLTQELEAEPAQAPQVQATLTFEAKTINANPQLKDAFIEFAAWNLATQDSAMIDSIVYLVQKYPDAGQKFLGAFKDGKKINPTISQLLIEQDKENNKTTMQKIAGMVSLKNIFFNGVVPILDPLTFLQSLDAHGNSLEKKVFGFRIPDFSDDTKVHGVALRLPLKPQNEWIRAILTAWIWGAVKAKVKDHAKKEWAWNFEIPAYQEKSWNVQHYGSQLVDVGLWAGAGAIVTREILNPLYDTMSIPK